LTYTNDSCGTESATHPAGKRLKRRLGVVLALSSCAALIALPTPAMAGSGGLGTEDDKATIGTTPGSKAKLVNGKAVPPANAPARVVRAIRAANRIEDKPYVYGGGHGRWNDRGYDCSGAVSYALGKPGARVLRSPMPSGSFVRWGKPGRGRWITTYANGGHMYAVIAGLRWDTSQTPGNGPGWSSTKLHQSGFSVRHPRGL
jgi:cell wall-associated NlpC family hydrolase